MALKTVGSIGRDFSALSAWATYFNALSFTGSNTETADLFNDSEFAVPGQVCNIDNISTSSTNFLTLKAAAGNNSFSTNANVRTNALYYNQANGVGIKDTATGGSSVAFNLGSPNTVLAGLQFATTDNGILFSLGAVSCIISNCIFVGTELSTGGAATNSIFNNCLFINTLGPSNRGFVIQDTGLVFNYCTFIHNPARLFYVYNSGGATFKNCAFFGGGTSGFNATTGTNTFDHCMTDIAGTTGLIGGKTFANQFISTSNDFRSKTGADLVGAGIPIPGITTDISGFTRNTSTPTIGAWELASPGGGGGGPGFTRFSPFLTTAAAGYVWKLGRAIQDGVETTRRGMLLPRNWRR